MGNQVTLTFAGEDQDLRKSFDDVGKDAQHMADQVGEATGRAAERFDYLSSQSSMLSGGIGDVGGALTAAFGEDSAIGAFGAEMERVGTIVMGFTGLMDLALFATNNLKLATLAKAGADRVAAAAQWLMNTALFASPLTWVVAGIVAVIAVIVLIAKKTDWFSTAWNKAWGWIKTAASNTWNWLKQIPGWIGTAFAKVADFISAPYRKAFNLISDAWNATIGKLSWTVPDWIPGIGGKTISVPNLPHFHAGGVIPGVRGQAVPFLGLAGERVSSPASSASGGELVIRGDGSRLGDALVELIQLAMVTRSGDPAALGIRIERR
jgi:hypothetical protein